MSTDTFRRACILFADIIAFFKSPRIGGIKLIAVNPSRIKSKCLPSIFSNSEISIISRFFPLKLFCKRQKAFKVLGRSFCIFGIATVSFRPEIFLQMRARATSASPPLCPAPTSPSTEGEAPRYFPNSAHRLSASFSPASSMALYAFNWESPRIDFSNSLDSSGVNMGSCNFIVK